MSLAIFDLDKTITERDTFIPFIFFMLHKQRRYFRPLFMCLFWGILYILKVKSRKDTKEKFIQICVRDISNIEAWSKDFAKFFLKKYLRNDAKKTIENHRALGHSLMLASASPSLYVDQFALELDIELVVSADCKIELIDKKPHIFLLEDLIGESKFFKIRKYHKILNKKLWAYTDSVNDIFLLQESDFAFAVNPPKSFKKLIKNNTHIKTLNWK